MCLRISAVHGGPDDDIGEENGVAWAICAWHDAEHEGATSVGEARGSVAASYSGGGTDAAACVGAGRCMAGEACAEGSIALGKENGTAAARRGGSWGDESGRGSGGLRGAAAVRTTAMVLAVAGIW